MVRNKQKTERANKMHISLLIMEIRKIFICELKDKHEDVLFPPLYSNTLKMLQIKQNKIWFMPISSHLRGLHFYLNLLIK